MILLTFHDQGIALGLQKNERGFLMFVLMDIEWIENAAHHINPTQIAAIRTDEQWNSLDRFYARIHPRDSSFHIWNHVAYSGGTASGFLLSAGIYRVLTNLQNWLQEDDVICFWFEESQNILKSIYQLVLKTPVAQRIVVLDNYLPFFCCIYTQTEPSGLENSKSISHLQILRDNNRRAQAPF